MFHSLRKLTIGEMGPWYPYRGKIQKELKDAGVKAGDILCRLGNAYVYGYLHLSKLIAKITQSPYSHAAMVIDVDDKDILIGDVDNAGMRRQFFVDWIDDVRSDTIGVLRFNGENNDIPNIAAEQCKKLIFEHIENPKVDNRRFCCVELICWCYQQAGVDLCQEVQINKMPGWSKKLKPLCWMEGVDHNDAVRCVGNKDIGLFSSPHLIELISLKIPSTTKPKQETSPIRGA